MTAKNRIEIELSAVKEFLGPRRCAGRIWRAALGFILLFGGVAMLLHFSDSQKIGDSPVVLSDATYIQLAFREFFNLTILSLFGALFFASRKSRWFGYIFIYAFGLFYFLSWSVYHTEGTFLNRPAILFTLQNLSQNLGHAFENSGSRLVINLIIINGAAFATAVFIKYLLSSKRYKYLSALTALVLGVNFVFFLLFPFQQPKKLSQVDNPITNSMYESKIIELEMQHAGPVSVLLNEFTTNRDLHYLPDADKERFFDLIHRTGKIVTRTRELKNKNVILILVESLRSDCVGLKVNGEWVTPNLVGLVEDGLYAETHYSQGSYSKVADIAALSGIYPFFDSISGNYPEVVNWPRPRIFDALKEIGYDTAIISSQNEKWGGMDNYLRSEKLDLFFHSENMPEHSFSDERDSGFHNLRTRKNWAGKLPDDVTIERAKAYVDARTEAPFFLYINLQNTHFPYFMTKGYQLEFSSEEELPGNLSFSRLSADQIPIMYRRYLDSVKSVDQLIGDFLDYLEQEDLRNDTIVVVTGDTGQSFGEHGLTGHGGPLLEEVLRVPLIINDGGGIRGRIRFPTQHVDIAPTLMDLLGIKGEFGFQGSSIIARDQASPVFFMVNGPIANQVGMRLGETKIIRCFVTGQRFAYNLAVDPDETRPLPIVDSSSPYYAKAVLLDSWIQTQLDFYHEPEIHTKFFAPKLNPKSLQAVAPPPDQPSPQLP